VIIKNLTALPRFDYIFFSIIIFLCVEIVCVDKKNIILIIVHVCKYGY